MNRVCTRVKKFWILDFRFFLPLISPVPNPQSPTLTPTYTANGEGFCAWLTLCLCDLVVHVAVGLYTTD